MSFSVSRFPFPGFMERETGFEPATNSLEGCDSTPELLPRIRRSCHPRQHSCARRNGGQGRIRTSVPRSGADLQSAAINHSATCPSSRETKTIDPFSPRDPRAIRSVDLESVPWSRRRDLNPQPSDYKSDALPLSYAGDAIPKGAVRSRCTISQSSILRAGLQRTDESR
jgi:hypothetical protein